MRTGGRGAALKAPEVRAGHTGPPREDTGHFPVACALGATHRHTCAARTQHTHVHTVIYAHMHTAHAYIRNTHSNTHVHAVLMHTRAYMHAHAHAHTRNSNTQHTCIHKHTRTCTRTYYTRACTCTHTHTLHTAGTHACTVHCLCPRRPPQTSGRALCARSMSHLRHVPSQLLREEFGVSAATRCRG